MRAAVIIPAYNEERYIGKTLESVLAAKNGLTEIIVVANGCTDSTEKIVNRYKRVKLISEKKKGIARAKNIGAKSTDAPALIFLDADTRISKRGIKRILLIIKKYDVGSLWVKPHPAHLKSKVFMTLKNIVFSLKMYHGTNGIIFCTREIFDKVGGFNEKLNKREDKDFVYSAVSHGSYRYIKSSYVTTSMRRFEKLGYFSVPFYWISVWFKEKIGKNNKEYPAIR